jgi:sugar-specific transcriptional regulator TrmB
MTQQHIAALTEIGLSRLEAEVYSFLAGSTPQTAYRVAKEIGRPTANVYKAVEALARLGGLVIQEGDNRECRAVSIKEFLHHLKKDFARRAKQVEQTLASTSQSYEDERVYQIQSVPLAFERCCTMLERCHTIAVVDAFPGPLERIRPAIEKAVSRGIEVRVEAYQPIKLPGANVIVAGLGRDIPEFWGSQQMNVVIDGQELLAALMNNELTQIHQAIWSRGLYLSCLIHAGLLHEQTITRLLAVMDQPQALGQLRSILKSCRFFHSSDVPGQKALHRLFIAPEENQRPVSGKDER